MVREGHHLGRQVVRHRHPLRKPRDRVNTRVGTRLSYSLCLFVSLMLSLCLFVCSHESTFTRTHPPNRPELSLEAGQLESTSPVLPQGTSTSFCKVLGPRCRCVRQLGQSTARLRGTSDTPRAGRWRARRRRRRRQWPVPRHIRRVPGDNGKSLHGRESRGGTETR